MLTVIVPESEVFDNVKNEFYYTKETTLQLEHSLVSLSKWESKWRKPFLTKSEKTTEETYDYIRCMTITQNVDAKVYLNIPSSILKEITAYIEAPMTATVFSDEKSNKRNREIITAELVYFWMIANNIPIECQKWHLNKLLTLIKVCSIKNAPPKKVNKKEILERNRALNAKRREALQTKG